MSLADKVAAANQFDLTDFVPFSLAGMTFGWLHQAFAVALRDWPCTFHVADSEVRLVDALDSPGCAAAVRTRAVDAVMRALHARGDIRHWRDELYPVVQRQGEVPVFLIERAAVGHFGFAGAGVHMNGYVRRRDGRVQMWVARRSLHKPSWPGMLDQLVAGGQPATLGVRENLIKECWEEAAIPAELAAKARPAGVLTYVHGMARAVRPDTVYCYDLELPADFVPRANDGEVDSFELLALDEVTRLVRDTDEFKFNCALVVIDFLIRHGQLDPGEPDYVAICEGLRAGRSAHYFSSRPARRDPARAALQGAISD